MCAGAGSGKFRCVLVVPESSGMCWCRFRKQVPEGSGEFRCVAGVGSHRFRKVPEGSEEFRCVLVHVPWKVAGSGRFRRVLVCAGVGSGGRFRKVPVCAGGSGEFRYVLVGSESKFRCVAGVGSGRFRKVPEGSEEFRCVLV